MGTPSHSAATLPIHPKGTPRARCLSIVSELKKYVNTYTRHLFAFIRGASLVSRRGARLARNGRSFRATVGAVRLRARGRALSPRATGFAPFSGDARAESVRVAIAIVVRRGALAAVVSAIAFFFLIACLDRSAPEVSAAEAGASARARPDRERRTAAGIVSTRG
jgi:hypothetical protein